MRIHLFALAVILLLGTTAAPLAIVQPNAQQVRRLQHGSTAPVLVPTRVPAAYGKTYAVPQLQPGQAASHGYSVVLGATPTCDGTACTFARLDAGSASEVEHNAGRSVTLANGTHATFATHACAANCMGASQLWFRRGATYYAIAGKGDPLPDLLVIANSLLPAGK
ncbi:MAG: hypothetical protein NVS3B28_25500 [Candidatus Velthaea sp.]